MFSRTVVLTALALTLAICASVSSAQTGGPDGFGYSFRDDTAAQGPTYAFSDISGTGTFAGLSQVIDGAVTVNLNSPFDYYGVTLNALRVSNHGYISTGLTDNGGDFSNDPTLPTTPGTGATGSARIYVYHDDIDGGTTGGVYHQFFASSPLTNINGGTEPCTIIQWHNMELTFGGGVGTFDCQVILFHTTGELRFQYRDTTGFTGSGATFGIQNDGATIGLLYGANTAGLVNNTRAISFFLPTPSPFPENFDAVTAPSLPAGWVAGGTGYSQNVVTRVVGANSQPNCAFFTDPGDSSDHTLTSPSVTVPAGTNKLTFRHSINMENNFDGGILEISINGGAFTEFLDAGGSFEFNGYNNTISATFGSPLASRLVWGGALGASFFSTIAVLPSGASGQPCQFRWRICSDATATGAGWAIDDVFFNPPEVTDVSPRSGPAAGGTAITITGINFTGATAVTINGVPCTGVTVVSSTSITCTTPPGVLGSASSVLVIGPDGESVPGVQTFTYADATSPTVSGVSPGTGPTTGATALTITGTNFVAGATVTVNGVAATAVTVVNSTTITCNTPVGTTLTPVSVVVTQGSLRSPQNTLFTYTAAAPTVTAVTASPGATTASTRVFLTGTGFFNVTSATFNGNAATQITVNGAGNRLTCVVPAGTAAAATPILVTAAGGTNAANTLWTYAAPGTPTIGGISPATGSTAGGMTIQVRGTNMWGVTGVTIDGIACTNVVETGNGRGLSCVVPPGTGTLRSVVVTTGVGSNTANTLWSYLTLAAPTVTSLTTATGSIAGGTTSTVNGTGFLGATAVSYGGVPVAYFTVNSNTSITVITAPGATVGAGQSVLVTTPLGTNAANAFWTYSALVAPTVTGVAPNAGLASGGSEILIAGTNFFAGATVTVGGVACTSVVVHSAFRITCTTGAGMSAGPASVLVTTSAGTNAANTLFTVLQTNAPAVANPATGSNFTGTANTGPFTYAVDPGTALGQADIELTDPESDTITVVAITDPATLPTGITVPTIPGAGHPVNLAWTGTADASNAPGNYTWTVEFEDAVNGASVFVNVTISINDLAPTHSIGADAGSGNGQAQGTAYEGAAGPGSTAALVLADVDDPNTGQALSQVSVTPDGANPSTAFTVAFNPGAGTITATPIAALTLADAGNHNFTVVVTDGTNPVSIFVRVAVSSNVGPTLQPATGSSFVAGSDFDLTVAPGATLANASLEAADATPDTIDVTVTLMTAAPTGITAPTGGTSIAPGSQPFALTWTGTADATNAPGTYTWEVSVDDGFTTIFRDVNIIISDATPTHAAATGITGNGTVGTPYTAQYAIGAAGSTDVADLDDANLGQSITLVSAVQTSAPSGLAFNFTVVGSNPAALAVTPASAPVLADVGNHNYTVIVEDDNNNQTTFFVTITVSGTAPQITSAPAPTTAADGVAFSHQFTATGNPAPTFAVTTGTLPAWATLTPAGLLSGTAALGQDISVTVSAQNGIGADDTEVVSVTVVAGVAPTFTNGAVDTTATVGQVYTFTFTATGTPAPTLSASGLPGWLTFTPATGVLTGTPTAGDVGANGPITITATNGVNPDDVETFTIQVSAGGNNNGGDDGGGDDGGCSTGGSSSWLVILGLLSLFALATRVRTSRE